MIKLFFTFLSVIFLSGVAPAQKTAHAVKVGGMQADGRGEVARTIDDSGTVKIWNLKDAQLVATMQANSPEWYAKQLRYKFYNYSPLKTDMQRKFDRESSQVTGFDFYDIVKDGVEIGRLKFSRNSIQSEDYSRVNDKLILHGETDGKGEIWIFDPVKNKDEAKLFASIKLGQDEHFDPEWSPKGNFIICARAHLLWDMEKGKKISFDKGIKPTGSLPFCFSAEEDRVSITTTEGITVLDTKNGKTIATYTIPESLRINGPVSITACADGKSFLYQQKHEVYVKDPENPVYKRVWLITEGKVLAELVD